MAKEQPWKDYGMNKADWPAAEVAKAVNAGHQWDCEAVDFNNPNRPLTCLEVGFPIIPINQIAAIEGNAGPYIRQEGGVLAVGDGRDGFVIDFTAELPVYKPWKK